MLSYSTWTIIAGKMDVGNIVSRYYLTPDKKNFNLAPQFLHPSLSMKNHEKGELKPFITLNA